MVNYLVISIMFGYIIWLRFKFKILLKELNNQIDENLEYKEKISNINDFCRNPNIKDE